jgi:hypothetical protein
MKNGKSFDFPFLIINQLYKARVAWKYCSFAFDSLVSPVIREMNESLAVFNC